MTPDRGQVLLVGSIAPEDGWSAEEVFRHSAATECHAVRMLILPYFVRSCRSQPLP